MTLNGEMDLNLHYFIVHRIRVRCRRKTIVRLTSVS